MLMGLCVILAYFSLGSGQIIDTSPPDHPVKLFFIHHSVGEGWLRKDIGNLGNELQNNNYYVNDISYGWDVQYNTNIGDSTDIGQWYTWFLDTSVQSNGEKKCDNVCNALFNSNYHYSYYDNILSDPGGENEIIMFKSCYPNSKILNDNGTTIDDLINASAPSDGYTLNNVKLLYNYLLNQFMKLHPEKMFVIITSPPIVHYYSNPTEGQNARELTNWLVNDFLADNQWVNKNVYIFNYFNVLTGENNHHRVVDGQIEHVVNDEYNFAYYKKGEYDSHPNSIGQQKATQEFIPLLNAYYHLFEEYKSSILGIKEKTIIPDDYKIEVYPNPFNPVTTITFAPYFINGKYNITNIEGKLIEQGTIASQTIVWDAENYPSGTYIITAIKNEIIKSRKVVLLK